MTSGIQHVIDRLRDTSIPAVREVLDVQRNAILWLSIQAGISAERSFFSVPRGRRALDGSLISDSVYLAAAGFIIAARVIDLPDAKKANELLDEITRRSPHTVELSGYADDPLCAIGLLLLATALGRIEVVDTIHDSLPDHVDYSAAITLAAAVANVAPPRAAVPNTADPSWLAAFVLAHKIDPRLSLRIFPTVEPNGAIDALRNAVTDASYRPGADIDSMLVLAALQTVSDSSVPSSAGRSSASRRKRPILFLAANPNTTSRLALDEEARDIEAKIRAAEYREELPLRMRWAVRADDLLQALNEDRPGVVHFSGHGAGTAGIVLHDDSGGERLITGAALRRLFTALKDDIRVVVLSACHSNEQAREIVTVIDCVVGMKDSIADAAARTFAAAFYRALGFGRSVANAFDQGVAAIHLCGFSDTDAPELLVRPGLDARDVFLVMPDDTTSRR